MGILLRTIGLSVCRVLSGQGLYYLCNLAILDLVYGHICRLAITY